MSRQIYRPIATITSFNPKSSYPQFARKEDVQLKKPAESITIKASKTRAAKPVNAEVKAAKSDFKKSNPNHKPKLLATWC